MISFENPWAALLIILPWLVYSFVPAYQRVTTALKVNFFERVLEASSADKMTKHRQVPLPILAKLILLCTTGLILLAMSNPVYITNAEPSEEPMRDLLIAVDLSGSMETKDFLSKEGEQINRLEAVKEVLKEFLQKRKGERIGLIFFGSAAFVQVPFTNDIHALEYFLDEAQVGMAGPQTMLGDAIGLSLKLFQESKVEDKMLILMSDGDDTGSRVPSLKAAELAKEHGVSIFTIGVGDPKNAGEHPLDTESLTQISTMTDGKFYYALQREELSEIYDTIDKLKPKFVKVTSVRSTEQLYVYALAAAFTLLFTYSFIMIFRKGEA